ncbi:hypothetical protein QAD02_020932 [Eretmocerus hayati]|uniref:Uncharacterized protein n=1 Tax=Eretmocerus hayati TaxID=131215 RepID=A0ACC2PPA5_9HYME|nr:hypothetical protein QAD02_020932 [Eretmocerus hayati]
MREEHFFELTKRARVDYTGDFSISNALQIYPTNAQEAEHNSRVLDSYRSRGTGMYEIVAQDQLIDATRDPTKVKLEETTPTDINKTGGLPQELQIFEGAKIMARSNINVRKGLVNGSIGGITNIE